VVDEVGPLPAERIGELVVDRDDETPAFVEDDPEHGGLVVTTRREIRWRGRSVSVPVPGLNPTAPGDRLSGEPPDPRDVTVGRLAAVANGNPGVAAARALRV